MLYLDDSSVFAESELCGNIPEHRLTLQRRDNRLGVSKGRHTGVISDLRTPSMVEGEE